DTGIGFSPEEAKSIFDPFYQADTNHNSSLEGTGIGLALVKELVELHEGSVTVRSAIGQGSEFTIQLPVKTGHADETMPMHSHEIMEEEGVHARDINKSNQMPMPHRKVILVVEDNTD